MTFLELAKRRCSVRNYTDKAVEQEKLNYILECARMAPSAVNFQPWRFVVIRSEEGRQKIRECYNRQWFTTAPLYILVCSNHEESWKRSSDGKDHADVDAAIAAEHICLSATEQELGCCWVCNFDTDLCRKYFKIPSTSEPVVIIPIGYPAEQALQPTEKKRKNIEEIITEETF